MKTLFIFLMVIGLAGITASAALADDWVDGSLWGWTTIMWLFLFASPSLSHSLRRIGTLAPEAAAETAGSSGSGMEMIDLRSLSANKRMGTIGEIHDPLQILSFSRLRKSESEALFKKLSGRMMDGRMEDLFLKLAAAERGRSRRIRAMMSRVRMERGFMKNLPLSRRKALCLEEYDRILDPARERYRRFTHRDSLENALQLALCNSEATLRVYSEMEKGLNGNAGEIGPVLSWLQREEKDHLSLLSGMNY